MERFLGEFDANTYVVIEAAFNRPGRRPRREVRPQAAPPRPQAGPRADVTSGGDPMRIREFRKGLAKSDRKDCAAQVTLWLRKMLPEVHIAPPGVQRTCGVFRMSGLFPSLRTNPENGVHGQLFELGVSLEGTGGLGLSGRKPFLLIEPDRPSS